MGLPNTVNQLFNGGSPYYIVNRSLRFRSSASAYLNRTPASASNRTTWTWSGWVKRGTLGASQYGIFSAGTNNSNHTSFYFTSDAIGYQSYSGGVAQWNVATNAVYRDPSAWYHLVVVTDTSNATSSNRILIYINGVSQSFSTASYPTSGTQGFVNQNNEHDLARLVYASGYSDLYFAEVNFIDGQALTPSSFGIYDSNGIWQPIRYAGTYGTNGFYLPFNNTTSTTTLVQDASGNGNNWTANNISLTSGTTYDSMIDSPTVSNASSNYAVLNPLDKNSNLALSDGNLTAIPSSTADYWLARATMQLPSSGKWYWELTLNNTPYLYQAGIYSANRPTNGAISATGNEYQVAWGTAYTYIQYQSNNAAFAAWGTNTNPTSGNVLMFAVDSDNATMWIGRNGTWYNTSGTANPATNTDPRFSSIPSGLFAGVNLPNPASGGVSMNFGQRPFSYTPPSGYNALNTANLPQPLISNGANYMAATLYTGNGGTQTINNGTNTTIGTSFQPDFVWIKNRAAAVNHQLQNSNAGWQYGLNSNNTNSEYTDANAITGATSSGWSMNNNYNSHNQSGVSYVGWNWKAGAGTTSTNTSGSITSTVSVNATAGFSIATFTTPGGSNPQTIGHGLGVAPSMIIMKSRNNVSGWTTYHSSVGNTGALNLSATTATSTSIDWWQNTSPTSSVWSIGANTNIASWTWVAYCFAAVKGYSAFGSYTGNGSTDGPFVYTGFRPRFILLKNSGFDNSQSWVTYDTSRSTYNLDNITLSPNSSNAESTTFGADLDILSNGFKIRNSNTVSNANGTVIIYAAFAENPFQIARAR